MLRVHKIKLNPDQEQEIYFRKACGVARHAYNWALAEWNRQYEAGEKPNEANLRKQYNAIKPVEFPWALEVTKCAPQQAIKNAGTAYKNFFDRLKKGKKGRDAGYPQFKKKGIRDSFRADNGPATKGANAVPTDGKKIKLPVIGWIRMREAVRFSGSIQSTTVSRRADGWYISVLVETQDVLQAKTNNGVVGIDLGLKTFATLSTGEFIQGPKAHRALGKRLRRLNPSLSRKTQGSANFRKAKTKLSRLHKRIADIRQDAVHKLTHRNAGRLVVKRLMRTLLVVKREEIGQSPVQGIHRGVVLQVDVLVLDRTPQSLDKNIVCRTATTIHADLDTMILQALGEGQTGKLRTLIGIEYPGHSVPLESLFQAAYAQGDILRVAESE